MVKNFCDDKIEALFNTVLDDIRLPKGMRFRVKTIKSGPVLESEMFPIWPTRGEYRKAKEGITREAARRVNERNSRKQLDRLMNANFCDQDICVTLTYDGEPPKPEQARKDVRNYLRRVQYARKKTGMPAMKYIYVMEWEEQCGARREEGGVWQEGDQPGLFEELVDTAGEEQAKRIHHHIVMSGMDRDEAERIWKKGRANSRRLQADDFGYQALAGYLVKAPKTKKRWYASRNLQQPKITVSDHKVTRKQVRELAERMESGPDVLRKVYPGYEMAGPVDVRSSDFVSGLYIYGRMIKAGHKVLQI